MKKTKQIFNLDPMNISFDELIPFSPLGLLFILDPILLVVPLLIGLVELLEEVQ